jgi:hypothetical protein
MKVILDLFGYKRTVETLGGKEQIVDFWVDLVKRKRLRGTFTISGVTKSGRRVYSFHKVVYEDMLTANKEENDQTN